MRFYRTVLSSLLFCTSLSYLISVPRVSAIASPLQTSQAQALIAAIDKQDITRVKALLAAGVSPKTTDANGLSALVHAASQGSAPLCELLLQKGAPPDGSPDMKINPLSMAVTKKHPEVVKYLLEHGADPNTTDINGKTPLFYAVSNRESDAMKLLLSRGADPNAHDKKGGTPLRVAQEDKNSEGIIDLVAAGADAPGLELLVAVLDHDIKTAAALLDAHAMPDDTGIFDTTPFSAACKEGDLDLVRLLVEHGAHINASDESHTAPLLIAIGSGHMEVARFLLEKGADAKVKDDQGNTALMLMQIDGSVEIARLLVEHGASVRAQSEPLHRSVLTLLSGSADVSVLQYLLEQGALADLNPRDTEEGTPLMNAAEAANVEAVKLFLEKGANPNSVDALGATALHYAANVFVKAQEEADFLAEKGIKEASGNEKPRDHRPDAVAIIKLLLQHGAKRDVRNAAGHTSLDLAQDANYRPGIEALKAPASGGK